jgi:hypothetical protein
MSATKHLVRERAKIVVEGEGNCGEGERPASIYLRIDRHSRPLALYILMRYGFCMRQPLAEDLLM